MALRRRVKRDLTVILGVIVILAIVIVVNYGTNVAKLASKFEAIRTKVEEQASAKGIEFLSWKLMRATTGSLSAGGKFVPELEAVDGQHVNIIGFMVPFEQFNHMTEFLVLPLPLQCYFCQIPPARDVMYVRMKEGTDTKLYDNVMRISGTIKLHKEAGTKFYYSLENAEVDFADSAPKQATTVKQEHTIPSHNNTGDLEKGFDPLAPAEK